MARILIYKSESKNKVSVTNEILKSGVRIREIIDDLKLKEPFVFLNNEKTDDFDYVLRREDLLFIFLKQKN
jgi:hypothetical protein